MKRIIALLSVVLLVVLSCEKSSYREFEDTAAVKSAAAPVLPEMSRSTAEAEVFESSSADSSPARERKRIVNAYLELTVKDVNSAEKEINLRTLEAGGWIVSSELYGGSISLVVKIPAGKFESFLSSSEKIGKVDSRSISTDDVTESYYDLENRIKNKSILRERFRDYLKKADSIEDILSVERQLNDVTTEIERLEGSFRGLNRDIDYSTVTFNLKPPVSETVSNKVPSFSRAFSVLKYKVFSFFYYLLFLLIYLVIFGIPVILIAGLIYFIGWGKVGLIRRFFKKLKK